jgi:hypothetical protein
VAEHVSRIWVESWRGWEGHWGPSFLFFWPFFEKNLTNVPLLERFQKMDPDLGVMDRGAELTRHGAMDHGAEMVQFLATVCERGVRRGQGSVP